MNHQPNKSEEIDIIQFFSAIGSLFKSLFRSIGNLFKWLFFTFIDTLLYLKKHRIALGSGLLTGLAISFIINIKDIKSYYGEATLRTNFDAQLTLQEKVDAINSFIHNYEWKKLGNLLGIPPSKASNFTGFKLEPVINDLFLIEDYESYLMTKDTMVYQYLEYEDFKKNIIKNDNLNPYWKLKISATSPDVFKNLNEIIVNLFNKDSILSKRKQLYLSYLNIQKQNYLKSLQDIDTMRSVFDKARLMPNAGKQSINLITSSTNSSNGGFEEAYNLFLERERALLKLKKAIDEINKSDNAVVLLNGFPKIGIKEKSLLSNKHIKLAFLGFLLVLIFLLLKDFNIYINKYQQSKKAKTQ